MLRHAVVLHVQAAAQNQVVIAPGSEHQVDAVRPVRMLDDVEIDMHARLLLNLLEKPHVVKIKRLVLQLVLQRGQRYFLCLRRNAITAAAERQQQKKKQQKEKHVFSHVVMPLCMFLLLLIISQTAEDSKRSSEAIYAGKRKAGESQGLSGRLSSEAYFAR